MNKILLMAFVFLLAVILPLYFSKANSYNTEGFSGYTLEEAIGDVPSSQTNVLVQDTYPITGINGISDNGAANIWWHYPIFTVGSYAQITNNIRYPNNPDEGTCMPASMCGALYKEKHLNTNYISQLPPINPNCGTRVGYFSTTKNLLPFRSNIPNVLY